MSENTAEVKITGDASGAEAAMLKAKEAVNSGVEGIKASLDGLNAGFEKISHAFLAFSAVMAGGSALKEFVSAANESVKESKTLGAAMGITATEASYLRVALGEAHVSQEALQTGASKITKALLTNEDSFKKLGVATRDSNGSFRSTFDIMQDTNAKLRDFKEGTDRNIEGMKIYGRSWTDVAPMVAKFKGITEEARQKAEDLNLVIGQEAIAASKAYSDSQQGVKDVMEGISNTIGQAILPRLTNLGNWFSSVGVDAVNAMRVAMEAYLDIQDAISDSVMALWGVVKTAFSAIGTIITSIFGESGTPFTAMEFFRNCLRVVEVAFIGLRVGIQIAAEIISTTIERLVIVFQGFADIAKAAFNLDWEGVKAGAVNAFTKTEEAEKASIERMKGIAQKGGEDIANALTKDLGKKAVVTPTVKKEGGNKSEGKDDGAPIDHTKEWDLENQNAKMSYQLENDLRQRDLIEDYNFWAEKLTQTQNGTKENEEVTKKLYESIIAYKKQSKTTELAIDKLSIDAARANAEQQISIERATAQQRLELNQITQSQFLAMDEEFEDRKNDIVRQSIAQEMALYALDPMSNPQGMAALLAKLQTQERTHQSAMLQIAMQEHAAELADFNSMQSHIVSLADSGIKSLMNGTLTWKNAYRGILNEMTGAFQDYAKKKLESWITTEKLQSAATAAENAIRTGLIAAGLIEDKAVTTPAAEGEITSAAAVAGANAFAATAAIPIVGPELAPEAAAAASSAVMDFSTMAGMATGNWNIPSDGITKVHKGETVLNATDAENFRQAKLGSGGGDVHLHVNAVDAHSVKRLFNDHASTLISVMKRQSGKFAV